MKLPATVEGAERSRGLGDTVAKVTKLFGIAPCGGCRKRRQMLNRVFPYRNAAATRR